MYIIIRTLPWHCYLCVSVGAECCLSIHQGQKVLPHKRAVMAEVGFPNVGIVIICSHHFHLPCKITHTRTRMHARTHTHVSHTHAHIHTHTPTLPTLTDTVAVEEKAWLTHTLKPAPRVPTRLIGPRAIVGRLAALVHVDPAPDPFPACLAVARAVGGVT